MTPKGLQGTPLGFKSMQKVIATATPSTRLSNNTASTMTSARRNARSDLVTAAEKKCQRPLLQLTGAVWAPKSLAKTYLIASTADFAASKCRLGAKNPSYKHILMLRRRILQLPSAAWVPRSFAKMHIPVSAVDFVAFKCRLGFAKCILMLLRLIFYDIIPSKHKKG